MPGQERSKLRIAVAGAGDIGRRHMAAIAGSRSATLCGIADPASIAAAAGTFQAPPFDSLTTLVASVSPDAVVIATPNSTHVELATFCIERGIPVLVEKPVAATVADAYALADHAERLGVPVLVGHHRRHNPLVRRAKEIVLGGILGDVVAISATWFARKPDTYFDIPWRREPGGGPILINLIHDIDTLRHLLGEIVAVQSVTARRRSFTVEDSAAIILVFDNGAIGTIALSDATPSPWSWELTAGESTSYTYPHLRTDCYRIAGSEASLGVPTLRLWRHEGVQSWQAPLREEILIPEPADPFVIQLEHFCAIVRGETAPIVTARDAARTLEVTLSIRVAAEREALVRVPV